MPLPVENQGFSVKVGTARYFLYRFSYIDFLMLKIVYIKVTINLD